MTQHPDMFHTPVCRSDPSTPYLFAELNTSDDTMSSLVTLRGTIRDPRFQLQRCLSLSLSLLLVLLSCLRLISIHHLTLSHVYSVEPVSNAPLT